MTFRHDFDPTSLREYDIRGVVGRTLHPADAFAIGRCFGSILVRGGGRTVAVGYDGRLSSPSLEPELVRGLQACGLEVLLVGLCPTPMLYYAATVQQTAGAVMVTGSHNPPDYNGFKMMLGRKPFFGEQIKQIGTMAAAGDVVAEAAGRRAEDRYRRRLHHPADQRLGWRGPHPQRRLGQRQRRGGRDAATPGADAARPSHRAERRDRRAISQPTTPIRRCRRTSSSSSRRSAGQGADLGIAFDGDADRIGVVDDSGAMLFGDQLLVILRPRRAEAAPIRATVIADVKASQVLFDEIGRAGGTPLMWKTGHSSDQGQDGRNRLASGRRNERPRVLRRPLVRLR